MIDQPVAASGPTLRGRRFLTGVDDFLARHHLPVAMAITVAAFAVRLLVAIPSFLNPDEVLHVAIAGNTTFADSMARAAMARSPHPFFYNLLIYLLNLLHAPDLVLRLPSVIAGALVPWFGFLWLRRAAGPAVGLGAAVLMAFLPEMVRLSAQVREYALLMLLVAVALYLLELGFDENRVWPVLTSGGFLLFALATHYATIWPAIAIGGYGLFQLLARRAPRRMWLAWGAVQLAFASGLAAAWFSHISSLMGAKQSTATEGWLRTSYFRRGDDSILLYPFSQTWVVFKYLFSGTVTGLVGLLAASAGIAMALVRRRASLAFLLISVFAIGCAASCFGFYPYGGTRHVLHLAPFAAAGVGLLAAGFFRNRPLPVLAGVTALLLAANIWPSWPGQFIAPRNQRRGLMTAAVEYLRMNVAPGEAIFCDYQSELMLGYYLGGARELGGSQETDGFLELAASGRRLVMPPHGRVFWTFSLEDFRREFERYVGSRRMGRDVPVWVFDAGWGRNLAPALEWGYGITLPRGEKFGDNISAFALTARQLPGSGSATADLGSLAETARKTWPGQFRTVLWPSDHTADSSALISAAQVAREIVSYRDLRAEAESGNGRFADYLPALAFWVLGNIENHPSPLRFMDEREDYSSQGHEYVLLAIGPDSAAAIYAVTTTQEAQVPRPSVGR